MEVEDRASLVYIASVNQNIDHYDEALNIFEKIIAKDPCLSPDEIHLYGSIVKSNIDPIRSTLQVLSDHLFTENNSLTPEIIGKIQHYFNSTLNKLEHTIYIVLDIISNVLLDKCNNSESEVFLCKLQGDLMRYLSEFSTKPEETIMKADSYYQIAMKKANTILPSAHPTRLGTILNYSVLKYEFQKRIEDSIELVQTVIKTFNEDISSLPDALRREAQSIFAVMESNIEMWVSILEENNVE